MVKVVQKPVYVCEICNTGYRKQEDVLSCEQLPTTDLKYRPGEQLRVRVPLIKRNRVGDIVSNDKDVEVVATVLDAYRMRAFWDQEKNQGAGEPTRHANWYKIKFPVEPYENSYPEGSSVFLELVK